MASDLPKPLFEQDGDFKVTIWRPGNQDGNQDVFALQIIDIIKRNPKISQKDLAEVLHTSPRTIARRIKQMGDKIRFVGSGYSGHWEVNSSSKD